MSAAKKHKGLGRGLDALLGDAPVRRDDIKNAQGDAGQRGPRPTASLPIEFLAANPAQPRRTFSDDAIAELAASLKTRGMLQPILVRPKGPDSFEIVAGERRWRAAQKAGLHEVPVVVRELTDSETAEIALIENIQRVDLSAMEEAAAYARLAEVYKRTQEQIAEAVGKSRSHVANTMRLNALTVKCREALEAGAITAGHARALLAAPKPDEALAAVVRQGMNVRDTERFIKRQSPDAAELSMPAPREPGKPSVPGKKDADTRALENDLSAALGLEVAIDHKPKGSGVVTISYRTLDQLDDVCKRLMGTAV
ncbi:MAG: ParB/RepB/Spo0J family partition protein [Parvularculaceae bacterium]